MDKDQLYQKVKEFTAQSITFTVAELMKKFDIGYGDARAAVSKLESNKLAVLKENVTFEYIGSDRKIVVDKSVVVKALTEKGEDLDPLFCDAFILCAKIEKMSPPIIMSEFNVTFERAMSIAAIMRELGLYRKTDTLPYVMTVGADEAQAIVDEYRSSRIIVASDTVGELKFWVREQIDPLVTIQIEHLCEWYLDGDCKTLIAKARGLMRMADDFGNEKNFEYANCVLDRLEEYDRSENGHNALYTVARERIGIIKANFIQEGLSDDYEKLWQKLKDYIVELVDSKIALDNAGIAMYAREERARVESDKTEDGIIKKLACDRIEQFTPLDFYLVRAEAKNRK